MSRNQIYAVFPYQQKVLLVDFFKGCGGIDGLLDRFAYINKNAFS